MTETFIASWFTCDCGNDEWKIAKMDHEFHGAKNVQAYKCIKCGDYYAISEKGMMKLDKGFEVSLPNDN